MFFRNIGYTGEGYDRLKGEGGGAAGFTVEGLPELLKDESGMLVRDKGQKPNLIQHSLKKMTQLSTLVKWRGIEYMKRKVERISNSIVERFKAVESIEAITLHISAESDIHDPYFFMSLDVYYNGALPESRERQLLFEDAGGFETSSYCKKDRFFMEDLPVRIEYKHTKRVEHLLHNLEDNLWAFRQTGTYMFFRIQQGHVLFSRGEWLEGIRDELTRLPEGFWEALRESFYSAAEHYLTDLKSAVVRGDDLFYHISLTGFVKSMCSMLFAVNRRFEPSGRLLFEQTLGLKVLPENFKGRFYSILRDDPEFNHSRKQEIAELLTRSVVNLR